MHIEEQILCLAARTHIDAHVEAQLVQLLTGEVDWRRLWEEGERHEVLALVGASLRRLADHVPLPKLWVERFQQRYYATLLENTLLAEELHTLLDTLRASEIPALAVKGVVLAETLYGDLGLRQAGDIDVLVRCTDLDAARRALHALGFAPKPDADFGHLDHPVHDPPYLRSVAGRQTCVELHWTLWASHLYGIDINRLWERAVEVELRGRLVRTLSPEDSLLHLSIHRARTSLRLRLLCDIAELLRNSGDRLDWDYLLREARQAGARTALYWSLIAARRLLGAPLPLEIVPQIGISRAKHHLLRAISGAPALFDPSNAEGTARDPSLAQRWVMFDSTAQAARALGYRIGKGRRKILHTLRG